MDFILLTFYDSSIFFIVYSLRYKLTVYDICINDPLGPLFPISCVFIVL